MRKWILLLILICVLFAWMMGRLGCITSQMFLMIDTKTLSNSYVNSK